MSSELLLLDANGWTWIAVITLVVICGYFFLDKLMRKGVYEEGRTSGGMMGRAGSALSELQTLVAPAQRNVIEELQERKRAEHDDAGDDPDPK